MYSSYRIVAQVAGNSEAVTLRNLSPDTQYQVTVSAIWGGKKYRSRPIVFRTLSETEGELDKSDNAISSWNSSLYYSLESPKTSPQQDSTMPENGPPVPPFAEASPPIEINTNSTVNSTRRELPTVIF